MKFVIKWFGYLKKMVLGYGIENPVLSGEYRMIRKVISKATVVIEVGANVGDHIQKYFEFNPGIKVHAFEPTPGSFRTLQQRFGQHDGVVLNHYALGRESGEADFQVYWETGGGNSFYVNDYQANISGSNKKIIKVKVETLDEYIKRHHLLNIDFLKMDVEGHEYPVMQGLENNLAKRNVHAIQFEYSSFSKQIGYPLEIIGKYLTRYNFEIYRITPWGKLLVADFVKWENSSANYLAILKKGRSNA